MSTAEAAFAANLKALRTAARMTQAQLASEMASRGFRWHAATVYKLENGERQIQFGEAVEIARIFDTAIEQLARDSHSAQLAEVVEIRDAYRELRARYGAVEAEVQALYNDLYAFAVPLAADAKVRKLLPPDELVLMTKNAMGIELVSRELFAVLGQSPPKLGPMSHYRLGNLTQSLGEALKVLKKAADDAET